VTPRPAQDEAAASEVLEPTPEPAPSTTPAYTPVPSTPTLAPTQASAEEAARPLSGDLLDRDALTARWPTAPASRVVRVRHERVWAGDEPDLAVVLEMLDAGVGALTNSSDTASVWQTLFDPAERVLLKVNCIAAGGPTQPAVTYAVAERLQDAGVAPDNILIFDRLDYELDEAGYSLNDGGPGVQCRGTRGIGSELVLTQATVRFSQELDEYDAIVNIPTPKQHDISGVSVSLKNHYGSINRPSALHGNGCDPGIAELNAHETIRSKTRLIVGAALNITPGDWNRPERGDSLLLSFDPVALDTVARDMLVQRRKESERSTDYLVRQSIHLATAQMLNVGATDPGRIDLREVALS